MKQIVIGERFLRILVWSIIGMVIAIIAIGITVVLIKTAPKASKTSPVTVLPAIRVAEVVRGSESITLYAQGEVAAVRRTTIAAEVGGKIIAVSPKFEAGAVFAEGEWMVRIDPADYRAAHANSLAALRVAELERKVELANGERARRDWEKLGRGVASDLVLRKPQLASVTAAETSAKAAERKAWRDLQRTEVRTLYPSRVEATYLDLGATVAAGTSVVDVMSLGPVEVRFPLSLEDYGYIKKENGSVVGEVVASARLGGQRVEWRGRLIRSEEFVETTTRSINVVAQFGEDGESAPPVGLFVDAELVGRTLEDVVVLPRRAMVDPTRVLIVADENLLEFREVEVVRTSENEVVVRGGLEPGERVCITDLNAPVSGMEVRIAEDEAEEAGETSSDEKEGAL